MARQAHTQNRSVVDTEAHQGICLHSERQIIPTLHSCGSRTRGP
jgi:hypothetical protein